MTPEDIERIKKKYPTHESIIKLRHEAQQAVDGVWGKLLPHLPTIERLMRGCDTLEGFNKLPESVRKTMITAAVAELFHRKGNQELEACNLHNRN